jgi:hypothetical protein
MHEIFPGNLRNPAHDRRAGAMCQFPTGQVYSTTAVLYHGTAVVLILVRYTDTSLYLGE